MVVFFQTVSPKVGKIAGLKGYIAGFPFDSRSVGEKQAKKQTFILRFSIVDDIICDAYKWFIKPQQWNFEK